MSKKYFSLLILMLANFNSYALEINNDESYVVKKGDTLWDISAYFFKDPWEWKTIWGYNAQIKNPHLIYPDDIISLVYKDGKPQLIVEKPKTLILNNGVKEKTHLFSDHIPYIEYSKIKDFDSKYKISNKINNKIIKLKNDNLISRERDVIYFSFDRIIGDDEILNIYSKKDFRLKNNDLFMYEKIGEVGSIKKYGNLYRGIIKSAKTAIRVSDVISKEPVLDLEKIYPSKPPIETIAKIVYSMEKLNVSKNDLVLIDKGFNSNIKIGNILKVKSDSELINVDGENFNFIGEDKGLLFIYRVYDEYSMAIILDNEFLIKKGDNAYYPLSKEQ